ncbi:invasion associated locus B family protein [Pseudophaeobacter sp.]|uniref:invasion associated locus B family protein n=1 Tax=Pseudophaeobacter sp. TaxID=1971739 RepID=UPI003299BBEF
MVFSDHAFAKPRQVAKHEDWTVLCDRQAPECYLAQTIRAPSNQRLKILGFPADYESRPEVAAGFTITFPKNVFLGSGVIMSVDGQDHLKYNFSFCDSKGCHAQIGVRKSTLNRLKHGNIAQVLFHTTGNNGAVQKANFSLKGFAAALEDLRKRQRVLQAK